MCHAGRDTNSGSWFTFSGCSLVSSAIHGFYEKCIRYNNPTKFHHTLITDGKKGFELTLGGLSGLIMFTLASYVCIDDRLK